MKLALFGGKPIREKPFPVWPQPTEKIKQEVIHCIHEEGWGIGSTVIDRLCELFADYHDSKYAIATSSGTTALWVALKAAGVKTGDEVIVPAYTFIATASSVLMANGIPVFADIDIKTGNIDPQSIKEKITSRTKVIMPVHIGGSPCDLDSVNSIAKKHGIAVVEDAAQAHGAEWKGKKVGGIGTGGCFSFQTSKNMTAGEGGIIVSNDEPFMDSCFSYYNCGRVREGGWYEHRHLGGNFRMSAIQAAVLIPQLGALNDFLAVRETNRKMLVSAISKVDGITPLEQYPSVTRSANHLFICRYDSHCFSGISRETFFEAMQAEGIYTYQGYKPLYREDLFIIDKKEYPWLEGIDYKNMSFPYTERLSEKESIWLKQNYLLGTPQDTQDVINAFEKVTVEMKSNPNLFLNRNKNN